MIAIRGIGSKIAQELIQLLGMNEEVVECERDRSLPLMCDRYLFCQGYLSKTGEEASKTLWVNAGQIMYQCEEILKENRRARICVIGSESGFSGSFSKSYAMSKAAIHKYIEVRKLGPQQQLICVAPTIIEDCQMTLERNDKENLDKRRQEHPKGRFLQAIEVARLVHFCLYVDEGYLSNVVMRMNGGGHTK